MITAAAPTYFLSRKGFPILAPLLRLTAIVLLVFLLLSCLHPAKAFSGIYLVESKGSRGNSTSVAAGYLHMCNVGNSTSCGKYHGESVAEIVGTSIVRPYMCILTIVVSVVAFIVDIIFIWLVKAKIANVVVSTIAVLFALITAVWQEVAVHATIHLIKDAKKGVRASGIVWSALALLCCTLAVQSCVKKEGIDEKETSKDTKQWPQIKKLQSIESFETQV